MMRVRACLAVAALAASVACNNNPTSPNIITTSSSTVQAFVTQVETLGQAPAAAVFHGGTVSIANGAGPSVTPTGPTVAADAGANIVTLQGSAPFQHVFVLVANTGQTFAPNGFYELDLTAPVSSLQLVVSFATTIPTAAFSLQFQVTDATGAGAAPAALAMTSAASVASSAPAVIASYSPSPAGFLGGTACTLSIQQGCLWEFEIILQELNGVGVGSAVLSETFTFGTAGTTVITGSLNISIPEHGKATIVRNFACGTGGTACATPDELAGGTYTYTLSGTDTNGNLFAFTGPVLTLTGQAGQ
jgi:hypothetical protein